MPGYGSGAVVLPWSSLGWQHHAAVQRKLHLTYMFNFPELPLVCEPDPSLGPGSVTATGNR